MISKTNVEKQYKGNKLINICEYNNKILEDYGEYLIYNKKIFKKNKRQSKYHKDKGHNIEIFKCKNFRKNEYERVKFKLGEYCSAKIKKEIKNNNNKEYIYEIINQHSPECLNNTKDNNEINEKPIKELTIFKDKCFEKLNNFKEYNRTEMKKSISDLYNSDKYNFPLTPNLLNNILNEWKKYSNKFNKYCIFENQKNLDGEQFLKKYTYQYIETSNKKERILIENIIWGDDVSISRLRESKNWMIDATYHHPKEFSQLLIIYYKDIISKEKLPSIYVLMNNKKYENYVSVLESIKILITQNNAISYNVETITTDSEEALILAISECFPEIQRIGCFYHYINDINRNAKLYNIFTDNNYKEFLKEISRIHLLFKGNIKIFDKITDELKNKYPNFENFVENYFIKNKRKFFVSKDFDYYHIPNDSRSNSYLESYNKYIKNILGENRYVNWFNFVNFLKNESKRIKNKLYINDTQNIRYSEKKVNLD